MGWKNVKNAYQIEHFVSVIDGNICIGSPYISDLIKINPQGEIIKRADDRINEELKRYQKEMDADLDRLKSLVRSEDHFEKSILVFTYKGGEILEKHCEVEGWPNVTHDGMMMYKNSFSSDRSKIVKIARKNLDCRIDDYHAQIEDLQKDIESKKVLLNATINERSKLGDSTETPAIVTTLPV